MSGIAVSKGLRLLPIGCSLLPAVSLPHFGIDAPRGGTKVQSKQCKTRKNAPNSLLLTTLPSTSMESGLYRKTWFLRGGLTTK